MKEQPVTAQWTCRLCGRHGDVSSQGSDRVRSAAKACKAVIDAHRAASEGQCAAGFADISVKQV